jgi:hypothetical protein
MTNELSEKTFVLDKMTSGLHNVQVKPTINNCHQTILRADWIVEKKHSMHKLGAVQKLKLGAISYSPPALS